MDGARMPAWESTSRTTTTTAAGLVVMTANQRYALYLNSGDGSFNYVSQAAGLVRLHSRTLGGRALCGLRQRRMEGSPDCSGHDLDTIELNYPNCASREPILLARTQGKVLSMSRQLGGVFRKPGLRGGWHWGPG